MNGKINNQLAKMKERHGKEWHLLPDSHPDKKYIHELLKQVEWGTDRKPFADIKEWKKYELEFIESNMDSKTAAEMAKELGRPVESIKGQMYKIRLKLKARGY